MKKPSYNSFNYNHRPAKSIERKIVLELLKELYGMINSNHCEYIGLGSVFFADFRLIHKELWIKKMINIEVHKEDEVRFKFNKPFSCIKLHWGTTTEVLPEIDWTGKKIVWLDYDQSLQDYMFEDIDIIFSNIASGSFFLTTCNSSFQKFYDRENQDYKVDNFKEAFNGYYPNDLTKEILTNKNSSDLILNMINNRIVHNLNNINAAIEDENEHLIYHQLLFIIYQDGAPMFSTGGIVLKNDKFKEFKKSPINKLPYIRISGTEALNIESPILTSKEIGLLNTYLPKGKSKFLSYKKLQFIPDEEREKYFHNYRYYPAFAEVRDF